MSPVDIGKRGASGRYGGGAVRVDVAGTIDLVAASFIAATVGAVHIMLAHTVVRR